MTTLLPNLKDRVFEALRLSSAPIFRADPDALLDGAVYQGPIPIADIDKYTERIAIVKKVHEEQDTAAPNIIGFKIKELELKDRNRMIRISCPKDTDYQRVEFYILGYGEHSRPDNKPVWKHYPFNPDHEHVAVVPRAVGRHFQTYTHEDVEPYTMHVSGFPPSLAPFMVALERLPEALEGLAKTAMEEDFVYESPETGVMFAGWKTHFVEGLDGLQAGAVKSAIPQRAPMSGGEHYFRYE